MTVTVRFHPLASFLLFPFLPSSQTSHPPLFLSLPPPPTENGDDILLSLQVIYQQQKERIQRIRFITMARQLHKHTQLHKPKTKPRIDRVNGNHQQHSNNVLLVLGDRVVYEMVDNDIGGDEDGVEDKDTREPPEEQLVVVGHVWMWGERREWRTPHTKPQDTTKTQNG